MGISQAMYTGITGLRVNADGMTVTANNIANANGTGFKRDRAEFEDLISMDIQSGVGNSQVGRGARLRNVKTMHSQGLLKATESITDMAVQGQGLFILSPPNGDAAGASTGQFYTRVGAMQFDKDGFLTDAHGNRVQGFMGDEAGFLSSRLTDVRIETNIIPPKQTEVVTMNVNLDARQKITEAPFDPLNPEKTANFNNTISVFDSMGRAHPATIFYKRVEESDGINWEWHAMVPSESVIDGDPNTDFKEIASGNIKFNIYGKLQEETTNFSEANFSGGALQGQEILFDFGDNIGEEGGDGSRSSSSIAARSDTIFHIQDGFENGTLKSLNVDMEGKIIGVFTNGLERTLAAVGLATFENMDGLKKSGENSFLATRKAGPPKVGLAATGTRGEIYSSSLEQSNVDLANEFVDMIMNQRLFQANSKSVTTADLMIEEVVNLKR